MKKKTKVLLSLSLLLLAAAVFFGCRISKYAEAQRLCADITQGKHISTDFSNGTTLPAWWIGITDIMQIHAVKIPLVEACYSRNVQAVEVLLGNGADPNYFFDGHWSPLEAATANGPLTEESVQIVRMLLQAGADPHQFASDASLGETFASWLSTGYRDSWGEQIILLLADSTHALEVSETQNLFICAAEGNHFSLVQTFLDGNYCDVNVTDGRGQTALTAVLSPPYKRPEWGEETEQMVQLLLDAGADPYQQDASGKSAYDYAVENGHTRVVEMIQQSDSSAKNLAHADS